MHGAEAELEPGRKPLPPGFWSLWSTVVLDLVGFGIILPILPLYTEDLGARGAMLGLVLAAYSLAQLIGSPYLGRLSDRHGRRLVLVIALCGSAFGHLMTGLAGSVWVVLAARAFDGFSGGSLSVAHAAAADLAAPQDRPRLFGLLGMGIAVGFVAGPALGSLAALGGKRVPFFVAAGLCAVNAATARWRLPYIAPVVGGPAVTGVGRGPWRQAVQTMTSGGGLAKALWAGFIASLAFSGFEATFALLGRRRVGLEVGSAGLVFAGVGLVLALVQGVFVGRAIKKLGEGRVGRIALVCLLAGFVVLVPAGGWPALLAGLFGLTVGQGLLGPSLATMVSSRADPSARGATFGTQQSMAALARVVGPFAGSTLFAVAVPAPYLAGALLCGLSLLLLT